MSLGITTPSNYDLNSLDFDGRNSKGPLYIIDDYVFNHKRGLYLLMSVPMTFKDKK